MVSSKTSTGGGVPPRNCGYWRGFMWNLIKWFHWELLFKSFDLEHGWKENKNFRRVRPGWKLITSRKTPWKRYSWVPLTVYDIFMFLWHGPRGCHRHWSRHDVTVTLVAPKCHLSGYWHEIWRNSNIYFSSLSFCLPSDSLSLSISQESHSSSFNPLDRKFWPWVYLTRISGTLRKAHPKKKKKHAECRREKDKTKH